MAAPRRRLLRIDFSFTLARLPPPLTSLRPFIAIALLAGGSTVAADVEFALPVASTSGTIELKTAPPLHWQTQVDSAGGSLPRHRIKASLQGSGFAVEAHVETDPSRQSGNWTLDPSVIALQSWLAPLAHTFGFLDSLGDLTASGTLLVEGSGRIVGGKVTGSLRCRLEDGGLVSESHSVRLAGLNLSVDLDQFSPPASSRLQTLSFKEASFNNVIARNGEVTFSFTNNQEVRIERARLDVFGGAVELAGDTFPLKTLLAGEVTTSVRILHVSLAEIAALLPDVIAEARGRLSGEIGVGWTKTGFKLGNGSLQIERLESVEVRLSPQPGFLTDHTPERLSLPAWTGALGRWLSPKNPAYETIRQIEMGLMTLQVETLTAQVQPAGDEAGRSATVRLSARPAVASAVDKVDFEVNVSGPLDEVLKLGLGNSFSVKMGSGP